MLLKPYLFIGKLKAQGESYFGGFQRNSLGGPQRAHGSREEAGEGYFGSLSLISSRPFLRTLKGPLKGLLKALLKAFERPFKGL